ncbi:MAG TPA: cell division protein FtsQ/DivIB [Stellaceae bacterium]|nr:cell division protein FtsQ/DivIB [Stellaceae bacterium]
MRFLTARTERSQKPARRRRRWSRRNLLAVAAAIVVAIGGAGWWLQRSGALAEAAQATAHAFLDWTAGWGLAVNDVQVEGRQRTSREAILGALGVARGTPILALDPAEAKRRLESLAWVRSASVERRLPDALYIRLVERQALAFWQRQGKLVLVDRDGVVVPSDRLDSFGALIVLVGPDAPKAGAALLDMLAGEPELAPHVAAAVRIGGRRWNLRLDSGIDIALPEEDPAAAWHRLAELERSDGILERDIDLVDMRLADRLVLRTAPSETAKPAPKKGRQPGNNT